MDEKEDPKFNKIWRTLDRALAMPVFSSVEHCVIQSARELSHTSSAIDRERKARAFTLNAPLLAASWGVGREGVYRAIRALKADNVLLVGKSGLRLNRRYRTWTGGHELTPAQAEYCDSADTRPVTDCGSYRVNASEPDCGRKCTPTVAENAQPESAPVAENAQFVAENAQRSNRTARAEREREYKSLLVNPPLLVLCHTGETTTTEKPKTIEALTAWVSENIDTHQYIESKLRGWVTPYGVSWTFDALMVAKDAAPGGIARYVNRTLLAWHAEGGPPHERKASAPAATSKVQARSDEFQRQKALMQAHYARKEAEDVQGA